MGDRVVLTTFLLTGWRGGIRRDGGLRSKGLGGLKKCGRVGCDRGGRGAGRRISFRRPASVDGRRLTSVCRRFRLSVLLWLFWATTNSTDHYRVIVAEHRSPVTCVQIVQLCRGNT